MRLILVDPNVPVCTALEQQFSGLPNVEIACGRFEDLPEFDCMVSAANSFGLMDGGVDAAIIRFFGSSLMERVQQRILQEYLGEQPVGTSIIVETGHPKHLFVAHTPTMRVPMPIARTDNVYCAMWAMLLAVRVHNQRDARLIEVVACPGLGTATGRVPPEGAARQMALAYRNFLHPPDRMDWRFAHARQQAIGRGGDWAFAGVRKAETGPGQTGTAEE
jgi:O-acetyl-ADP-ribose deacetylase (regulator of RNase III)